MLVAINWPRPLFAGRTLKAMDGPQPVRTLTLVRGTAARPLPESLSTWWEMALTWQTPNDLILRKESEQKPLVADRRQL